MRHLRGGVYPLGATSRDEPRPGLNLRQPALARSFVDMATSTPPEFDEGELLDRSPALVRLKRKRLAPSRWKDLVKAAGGARPPKEPEPWACCGSSCKPCVLELYRVRPGRALLAA